MSAKSNRGVKLGTVRGSYAKNFVVVKYPAAVASKSMDWKIRLAGAGHEIGASLDEDFRVMTFEVRASRATKLAEKLRNFRINGKRVSAKVYELMEG